MFAVLAAAAALSGTPAAAPRHLRRLSDKELVAIAASKFDKGEKMFKREVLGRHRGSIVIAEYPCGDICPQYTRRIIHYDVPVEACARVGGIVVEELVPVSIAVGRRKFCEPAAVARAPRKG